MKITFTEINLTHFLDKGYVILQTLENYDLIRAGSIALGVPIHRSRHVFPIGNSAPPISLGKRQQ